MESVKVKDPKDEQILNKDNSVTNMDDENVEQPETNNKPEKDLVEITDNDAPGQIADENASNKGQGPSGENL